MSNNRRDERSAHRPGVIWPLLLVALVAGFLIAFAAIA
jgi:hypothetical protein